MPSRALIGLAIIVYEPLHYALPGNCTCLLKINLNKLKIGCF